eukprot:CAMPEP_0198214214 /NCGR_PEP_ID=MMETSP1445-20131203/39087_1 /TAXON_ID=36898 /ORGANISM="Pyramimonas sp., Strain CCMP2087" /LENGTH=440 /DNA_ID=CAMNT_0043889297 /DNA_START=122 /DNA_END=1444 /DNA_ORIENTATION=+
MSTVQPQAQILTVSTHMSSSKANARQPPCPHRHLTTGRTRGFRNVSRRTPALRRLTKLNDKTNSDCLSRSRVVRGRSLCETTAQRTPTVLVACSSAASESSALLKSVRNGPLAGKVAIVTGCDRGLGRHIAESLVAKGASVQMACIDTEPATRTRDELNQTYPGANVVLAPRLDLADMSSVRKVAEWFLAFDEPLDILVNNAGANFFAKEWYTAAGIGGCAQINFLGPYFLTRLLVPALLKGSEPRVVSVASVMHRFTSLTDPDAFLKEWGAGGYRAAKLAVVLFTKELQRRLPGVTSVAVDPGSVYSGIWDTSTSFGRPPLVWLLQVCYAPVHDGAAAPIHAATIPTNQLVPGGYYARGMFRSAFLSATPFTAGGILHQLACLVCSLLDWPLRRLLRGHAGTAVTSAVSAAPTTDDTQLSARMWEAAAAAAQLPSEIES